MTSRSPTTGQAVLPQLRAIGRPDLIPADRADLRTNLSPRRDLIAHHSTPAHALRKANRALMADLGAGGDLLPAQAAARVRHNYAASNAARRARWFPERAAVFSDPQNDAKAGRDFGAETALQRLGALFSSHTR